MSSLSALIAQAQQKQEHQQHSQEPLEVERGISQDRPAKRRRKLLPGDEDPTSTRQEQNLGTSRRRQTTRVSPSSNKGNTTSRHLEEEDERKPAAKRKRRQRTNNDNDDSSGVGNPKDRATANDDDDDDSLYLDDCDESEMQQKFPDPEAFQDHYTRAFEVVYGPAVVPAAARSSSSVAPTDDYLQTIEQVLVPNVPPPVQYSLPHERKQPRFVKRRNAKTKTWETVEETPEQAQRRFDVGMRRHELVHITERWKQRNVDLRNEQDVGGAMLERARRQLRHKLRLEALEQAKQQHEAKQALQQQQAAKQAHHEEGDDEDSVQEQQDVLDRLTQQSVIDEKDQDDATIATSATAKSGATSQYTVDDTIDQLTSEDVSVAYRDRMEYWDYGFAAPKDVEFDPGDIDLTPRLDEDEELEDPDANEAGFRLPLSAIMDYPEPQGAEWAPSYFPTKKPGHLSPLFYQYRLMQSLATRHLCGGSLGEDPQTENRYLRLLFSPLVHHDGESRWLARFAPSMTYLRLSHQLGRNALLFSRNTWSDPAKVARELCLLQESPVASNNVLAGRMQNPSTVLSLFKTRRKNVAGAYKLGSRPWIHKDIATVDSEAAEKKDEQEKHYELVGVQVKTADSQRHLEAIQMDAKAEPSEINESLGEEGSAESGKRDYSSDVMTSHVKTEPDEQVGSGTEQNEEPKRGVETGKPRAVSLPMDSEELHERVKTAETVDGTSTGGVIIDLQTNVLQEYQNEQIAATEAKLVPTTAFAHMPGTSPPVPPFPLDPVGIIYGSFDRHSKHDHQEIRVHHGMFQLALSTLLSRVVRCDQEQRVKVAQQIQSLLVKYADIAENKAYRRTFVLSRGEIKDVPLVQFYRAIQSYCSYWANGCPILAPQDEAKVKQEIDTPIKEEPDNDLYITGESHVVDTRRVANHLFDFLEHRIQHNGLVRFPRLHATYALASVARKLPAGAAEILTRALDKNECPTPLHIMRQTCEYLESNGYILGAEDSGFGDGDQAKRAGEWEYMFFEVAEIFEKCLKATPMEPDYHAWYIGALAVCFLLCSGNRIGSAARRYSSSRSRKGYELLGSDRDYLKHEIREKLPKYEEVGSQLSLAIRVLYTLTRHQGGATKAHLTLVSVLEWKQVVALLAGETLDANIERISSLHRYHSYQRFLQEHSDIARQSIVESSKTADFWAAEVENDPGDIQHWRKLVQVLGPVGECPASVSDASEHRSKCDHCNVLRHPRIVNHEYQNGNSTWWGQNREWWVSSLLQLKEPKIRFQPRRFQPATDPVLRKLEESTAEILECGLPAHGGEDFLDPGMIGWIPTREGLRQRRAMSPSMKDRDAIYDERLPPSPDQTQSTESLPVRQSSSSLETIPAKAEVLGYKIFIFCHLVGPSHPAVESTIYTLIRASWDAKNVCVKTASDEFLILKWLFSQGVDIPKMVRQKSAARNSKKSNKNDI